MHSRFSMRLTKHNKIYFLCILMHFHISLGQSRLMSHSTTVINDQTQEINFTFTIPKDDCIYKDFITLSVYEPQVNLSQWKTDTLPTTQYDPLFKQTKQIFNEDFTLTVTATTQQSFINPVYIYCSYYRRSEKKINQTIIALNFTTNNLLQEQFNLINPELSTDEVYTKISTPHHSPIDDYFFTILWITHCIVQSLRINNKKYFLLLLMLICLLLTLSYLLAKQLKKHTLLEELIDVTTGILTIFVVAYALFYLSEVSSLFTTTSTAHCCALGIGLFYMKKSTKLQSGSLRTLCTIIGTLCIYSAIFLLFKTLQHIF